MSLTKSTRKERWFKFKGRPSELDFGHTCEFTKGKLYKLMKPKLEDEFAFIDDFGDANGYSRQNSKWFIESKQKIK